ncbi:tetratricopeptide repeat protein, partial [bacterium]|nr:tetratricopeptide repeat protein [bacterium]
ASVAAKAYQLAPDTAAVADTYGWILYQNGEREQAIELLERAVELDSSNAEIAAHLNEAKNGA